MAEGQRPHSLSNRLNLQAVLFAAALLLPGLVPSIFGWLTGLLAVPTFCLLIVNGQDRGIVVARNGALIAVGTAILLKLVPSVLFALTLVPLGYSFSRSYENKVGEIRTGFRGIVVLAATWLIYWFGYAALMDINPYGQLLETIDQALAQLNEFYSSNEQLPAESVLRLQLAVNEARRAVPLLVPAMLCCAVLMTVALNLILSARFQEKIRPAADTWKKYSEWKLPDQLIWLFIGAGILLLFSQERVIQLSVALFLSAALLYFFQGLAVFIYMLEKWNVPSYLRILVLAILILQSFGILLLTIAGLADVWFDFRHKQHTDKANDN